MSVDVRQISHDDKHRFVYVVRRGGKQIGWIEKYKRPHGAGRNSNPWIAHRGTAANYELVGEFFETQTETGKQRAIDAIAYPAASIPDYIPRN